MILNISLLQHYSPQVYNQLLCWHNRLRPTEKCTNICTHTHIHAYRHTKVHTHTHIHTDTHRHTQTHRHIHTHKHTHKHLHIHTHCTQHIAGYYWSHLISSFCTVSSQLLSNRITLSIVAEKYWKINWNNLM